MNHHLCLRGVMRYNVKFRTVYKNSSLLGAVLFLHIAFTRSSFVLFCLDFKALGFALDQRMPFQNVGLKPIEGRFSDPLFTCDTHSGRNLFISQFIFIFISHILYCLLFTYLFIYLYFSSSVFLSASLPFHTSFCKFKVVWIS